MANVELDIFTIIQTTLTTLIPVVYLIVKQAPCWINVVVSNLTCQVGSNFEKKKEPCY